GMAKSGVDLSKLSLEELNALSRDIESEIEARRAAEKERVLSQLRELAASLGMSLEELLKEERKKGHAPVQAKYRNPEDPSQTWSGRGKRPLWVVAALEAGKTLEDLAV